MNRKNVVAMRRENMCCCCRAMFMDTEYFLYAL